MKKLSLLSLLWLTGLLAFIATPIYAQNITDEIFDWAENLTNEIVDGAEDLADEIADGTENIVNEAEDALNDEIDSYDYDYDFSDTLTIWDSDQETLFLGNEGLSNWTMALLLWLWFWALIFAFLGYIYWCLIILAQWEVYRKAGKKLRAFLVPFWGTMVYSEIAGIKKWTWLLPWLLAIVSIFWTFSTSWTSLKRALGIIALILAIATLIRWIVANYRIARRYGWWKFASVLHIIFFPITVLVLWLWNYKYQWAVKKEVETVVEA